MARSDIKATAIPLSGYVYQNLVGLSILCDWLDDPGLYEWVAFECDDDAGGYQGLDDVVAQRRDGTTELTQVKFTVDAEDPGNALSWEWLLAHKPKGRSLIQKWADAYYDAAGRSAVEASLLTNRRPDYELAQCLSSAGDRIDFRKLPSPVVDRIATQIGATKIEPFLDVFVIRHSHQNDRALERLVLDRYVPTHTTSYGWLALRYEALNWAIRKGAPPPDGHITLGHLRTILAQSRPKPIEQNFRIPANYELPDEDFFQTFFDRVTTGSRRPVVLRGSPGQGKSTFLSYLCKELEKRDVPYIRHHYFLTLGDSEDRFTLHSVANSLMSQIEVKHARFVETMSPQPEHLRAWIAACAEGYGKEGKPFIVIVDGLDHVWREHNRNKDPLDSLFSNLLPADDNVMLVMGSQPVDSDQLPKAFAHHIQPDDWVDIPRMSITAIAKWLRRQLDEKRFEVRLSDNVEYVIAELAQALWDVTGGHPLILTYTLEQLVGKDRVLDGRLIRETSPQTGGDIDRYYATLWESLADVSRDALHLFADTGFLWPMDGLEQCLSVHGGRLHREFGHLMHVTDAGLLPFHGSILAFAKSRTDHEAAIRRTRKAVIRWLEQSAPPFHRWGWLWLYQAKDGDPSALLEKPTREWIIESICAGYPVEQITSILHAAEQLAFQARNFPLAIRFRWLSTNAMNGKEFQIDDFRSVTRAAFDLANDDYPFVLRAVLADTADEEDLYLLSLFAAARGNRQMAIDMHERLLNRINDKINARAYRRQDLKESLEHLLDLSARLLIYRPSRLAKAVQQRKSMWRGLLEAFITRLGANQDLDRLVELHSQKGWSTTQQGVIEQEIIRTAARTGVKLHETPEFGALCHHPMVVAWSALYGVSHSPLHFTTRSVERSNQSYNEQLSQTEGHLYDVFWASVAGILRHEEPIKLNPLEDRRSWLEQTRKQLVLAAAQIATTIRRKEPVPFSRIYMLLVEHPVPKGHEHHSDLVAFRHALLQIAADLFFISMPRSLASSVPDDDWTRARSSPYFMLSNWYAKVDNERVPPLSQQMSESLLAEGFRALSTVPSPFNERVEQFGELCDFALHVGMTDEARRAQHHRVDCIVGYIWRKNDALAQALKAVEALADHRPDEARAHLDRLAPIVNRISDVTEDDAVRPYALAPLILKLRPEIYSSYYGYWIDEADWYYAERALSPLLSEIDLSHPLGQMLAAATFESSNLASIRENRISGEGVVFRTVQRLADRFGYGLAEDRKRRERGTTETDQGPLIDGTAFDASQLDDLLLAIDKSVSSSRAHRTLEQWFDANLKAKRGREILRVLEPHRESDQRNLFVASLYDRAFDLCRSLNGKKAAYKWIVSAHIHRYGWDHYHYDEERQRRFDKVAHHYSEKWDDFVHDTSRSPYDTRLGSSIPSARLVELMVKVGQPQAAVDVTETIVSLVVDAFHNQPLGRPSWLDGVISDA
ncbi:NACHT domain-containing protein [Dyella sp. LX-66]|uniref:NACHT domain-containing protein n=1 Tax=unclassified Dyella TaxID=2634549 RepID=UPI001BE093BC|nr:MULTISPECIES: ATP-binding protein [unclassified Dyella]MBT2117794.1 NACHT domain-containing protein [Dyella sp. LX-1]MBT2141309.1 NACHT domain-containing protein [Dyella sp. LX-66]